MDAFIEKLLRSLTGLPKTILAFLLLFIGIVGIILLFPPHTVCESQVEVFKDSQKNYLFLSGKRKKIRKVRGDLELRDTAGTTIYEEEPTKYIELLYQCRANP